MLMECKNSFLIELREFLEEAWCAVKQTVIRKSCLPWRKLQTISQIYLSPLNKKSSLEIRQFSAITCSENLTAILFNA